MKTLPLAALFCALPAFATTVVALDVPGLARAADSIVQGKVLKIDVRASKDGRRITTHIQVAVSEALKGQPTTVEIEQPGGELGDVGQRVSGTAKFAVGDEVVVFLEQHGPRFLLVGMAQGKFKIERSSDGSAAFAVQDPEGEGMRKLDRVTGQVVEAGPAVLKLDDLKALVRTALAPPVAEQPAPKQPDVGKAVK